MNNSGLGGGFLSSSSCGFLDLESPIARHDGTQLGHQSNTQHHHRQVKSSMTGIKNDLPIRFMEAKGSTQKGFPDIGKRKVVASVDVGNNNGNSSSEEGEEDESGYTEDGNGENFTGAKGRKGSPWQRMKWTDDIVRLLIAVVAHVGDDSTLDGEEGPKRKSAVLQKKGKWKMVSNVMISKGCHVSPQQCEDKFNDLNKRYKKLNDILGRGTSCRVVEDPTLMDSMPNLSTKMKEDVRKILNSKHLFYQEMCAYHNGKRIPNCDDVDLQVHSLPIVRCTKDTNDCVEEEAEENNESDDEDDESENEEHDDVNEDRVRMEEQKKPNEEDGSFGPHSSALSGFEAEMAEFFQDSTKSLWERRQWVGKKTMQLQEQRVSIEAEAFELEKQCFKWRRFCSKKERELERSRLENERMMLENERMGLELKQKEFEINLKSSEASLDPSSLNINRLQRRDQIDLGRH